MLLLFRNDEPLVMMEAPNRWSGRTSSYASSALGRRTFSILRGEDYKLSCDPINSNNVARALGGSSFAIRHSYLGPISSPGPLPNMPRYWGIPNIARVAINTLEEIGVESYCFIRGMACKLYKCGRYRQRKGVLPWRL